MYRSITRCAAGLSTLTLGSSAFAVVVDGSRVADGYGGAVAVQHVSTGFGDNLSELNAGFMRIENDRLYLMFTGNLENVWNRLEIFVDSIPGGMNEVNRPGSVYDRFTFDEGFEPDYLMECISGPDTFVFYYTHFDSDITSGSDSYRNVFDGQEQGAVQTEPGANFGYSFDIAFDNSNTAGVLGGNAGATSELALSAITGIEVGIPLEAIGNPQGAFKLSVMINGANGNFLSNQFLGSLEGPQANLGSDGEGNLYQTLGLIDLNDFEGEQFFTFDPDRLIMDVNSDGFVGLSDLDLILANWNRNSLPADPAADLNGDGYIGLEDLDQILSNWNAGAYTGPGIAIPEPVAGLFFLLGLPCLTRRLKH